MPTEVIMPKVDMDMESGTIAAWHAGDGDHVEKGTPLFDIETDKAAMEVEAPSSGRLANIIARPGDVIAIGKPLAWIYGDGELVDAPPSGQDDHLAEPLAEGPEPSDTRSNDVAVSDDVSSSEPVRMRASPLARRMARTLGIDLATIKGSGPRGRVMRRDVDTHHQGDMQADKAGGEAVSDDVLKAVPVDRMRAAIARRLTESKSTVPHFYLDMDCRLDRLMEVLRQLNEAQASRNRQNISINDLIIKATALALEAVPEANASWHGDVIHHYRSADIAMAVALDDGLVTPVIKDVANLSIGQLSARTRSLAEKARQGKLPQDAMRGARLTVTNLGMFGVTSFAAIINPPESMILAVGKAERCFVPDENDAPIAVTTLPLTLSCDHRVIDGALGARWLSEVKETLENPMRLLT